MKKDLKRLSFTLAQFKTKLPMAGFNEGAYMDLVINYEERDEYNYKFRTSIVLTSGILERYVLPASLILDTDYLKQEKCLMNESFKELGLDTICLEFYHWDVAKYLDNDFISGIGKIIHNSIEIAEIFNDDVKKVKP